MPIDRRRYPKNWNLISYFVRFTRAKGKCEFCGAEHGKQHPATGSMVYLQAIHVKHTLEATSWEDYKAACQKCHFNYDRRASQMARRYGKCYRDTQLDLFT
ncbi:hypothetical protein HUW51_10155 [Adhaeribacter swui]|uniref:HNH endonuclease n=1 Tax=Adhaeribacter swui TaxID=2086471 RepID=A0A7G7G7E0_9BACT|nr:hypothetical protein [Adhaeribacter swui]QNF33074.1 hypothetical protein HUW51_10155 [Adhaeribacter swui]